VTDKQLAPLWSTKGVFEGSIPAGNAEADLLGVSALNFA